MSAGNIAGWRAPALVVVLAGWMLSACAYNYAAREARRPAESSADKLATERSDAGGRQEASVEVSASAPAAAEPVDVCAKLRFELHYYDDEARQVRQVACEGAEVLSVQRAPTTGTFLERARQARHPAQTWFVLVDPEGLRTRFLSNRQLRELQARYKVDLVGRDPVDDVLIYQVQIDGF